MGENEKKKMQHNVQQKLWFKRLSAFGDQSYSLVRRRLLHFLFNSSSSSYAPSRLVPFHSLVVHAVGDDHRGQGTVKVIIIIGAVKHCKGGER